ncbi:MAG: HD domain-containing protein [Clostridium sp.]|nr:HD domain-containing protein [Clostridium sp.]
MHNYILAVNNRDIMNMAKRAFDLVDSRLIGHGERVSRIMYRLLKKDGTFSPLEIRNLLILAVLHDIGAYKMEEIDRMLEFETKHVWNHSIYGYLFFDYFTFLSEPAPIVLFHHSPWSVVGQMENIPQRIKWASQLLHLADRVDIYNQNPRHERSNRGLSERLERAGEKVFSREIIKLARSMDFYLTDGEQENVNREYEQAIEAVPFTEEEKEAVLKMLTYAIDFRSPHTVTHTITTTVISLVLAERLCSDPEEVRDVYSGAMLHDLGKIGIPVEILEFPGKLSPQAMTVMKTHVMKTEYILGDSVSESVREIALRHHEKLDGSGYPRGLSAEELTIPQRIVSVADIVSALTGTRSYKGAFSKEKTTGIVTAMAQQGFLDPLIVSLMTDEFDVIMEEVRKQTEPILKVYGEVQSRYTELSEHMEEKLWIP